MCIFILTTYFLFGSLIFSLRKGRVDLIFLNIINKRHNTLVDLEIYIYIFFFTMPWKKVDERCLHLPVYVVTSVGVWVRLKNKQHRGHRGVTVLSLQVHRGPRTLLINSKSQQKRITRYSAGSESRHTTPIKAPIHMKASADNGSFSGAALPASLPVLLSGSVAQSVSVWVWACDLPLERPACCWGRPLLRQNAGSAPSAKALTRPCPPVCLPDWRVPIGDPAVQLPAGPMKSLFDSSLDWLGSPSVQAAAYQPSLIEHVSGYVCEWSRSHSSM